MLTIIIPIITTPYLARVLGVNGTGTVSYTLSIVSYFIVLGSVGVSSYGQREIAMHRNVKEEYSKIFWELFFYKCITSVLSLCVYIWVIISMQNYFIIMLILIFNILASILDISWLYQGLEEYKYISLRNIVIKLLFTGVIFLFITKSEHLILYVLLHSLSLVISSVSLWLKLPSLVIRNKLKDLKIFSHWKNTLIYFLPQIATSVYTMLDKTMLGIITQSEIENGYYEQAHKIINISLTVITSLNTVMSPRMSYLYKEKKTDEIKLRLLKSLKFACLLGIPICFGIMAISEKFVPWFFGSGYEKVSILLPIFAPIIVIIALSNCLGGQCLTPCGKRGKSAIVLWGGAFLNFLTNLLLIPRLGSIGAVIASIVSELLITIFYFYLAREFVNVWDVLNNMVKYMISGVVMFLGVFLFTYLFPANMIFTFLEIVVGMIIYFGILILIKDDLVLNLESEVIVYGKKVFFKRRNNM